MNWEDYAQQYFYEILVVIKINKVLSAFIC